MVVSVLDTVINMSNKTPKLRHLFSPIQINSLTLPNRSMMSSIHLNLEDFDNQYQRMANFYALRALKGVGLIVTGGCAPDAGGAFAQNGFSLKNDDELKNHKIITQAVHSTGGRIALQIMHFGREAVHGNLVSASSVKLASSIFKPKELTEPEILQLISDFAQCARRAIEAGYDAIELIYSQGFLVHQFLAPATNLRNDRWGGSLENRMRLAVEIAKAVRAQVGPEYPLIFRIPCMDLIDNGLPAQEALSLIETLLPFGIDLLSVSIGWHDSYVPTIAMVAPRAAFASATRMVRERFPTLKLCASNRINDPRTAETLLMDGTADMIAMARPFLADPALISKAQANDFDDINPCIACNQNCLDYVFAGEPVGCSVHPQAVREEEGSFTPLATQKRVAVIGGGIAGMGVALFLARRGAEVDLFESASELGGQLLLAISVPDKQEFAGTLRYYRQALLRAGVRLKLNTLFDTEDPDLPAYDHIMVATGCEPRTPNIPGIDLPHVRQYTDVLGLRCPVQTPVVIIGGGGVACDLAKYVVKSADNLRNQAHVYLEGWTKDDSVDLQKRADPPRPASVTIIQRSSRKFAMRLGRTTRWIQLEEMSRLGVNMRNRLEILEITPEAVCILDKRTQEIETIPAKSVIVAAGHEPRLSLTDTLSARNIPFTVVGSALTEGTGTVAANISSSLSSAYRAATAL